MKKKEEKKRVHTGRLTTNVGGILTEGKIRMRRGRDRRQLNPSMAIVGGLKRLCVDDGPENNKDNVRAQISVSSLPICFD